MMRTADLIDVGKRTRIAKDRKPGRTDLALWECTRQDVLTLAPAAPPVTATCGKAIADWIDPQGSLQAAGLLRVVPGLDDAAPLVIRESRTPTSPATARDKTQAPAVKGKRPRSPGGQPEGKKDPARFTIEPDGKFSFGVKDTATGGFVCRKQPKAYCQREARRLNQDTKGKP